MTGGTADDPRRRRAPSRARACAAALLEIAGDAGERLGGPLSRRDRGHERRRHPSSRGDARARAPATACGAASILIEGAAGDYAGSRMIAGTLSDRRRGGRAARLSDEPRHDAAGGRRDEHVADVPRLRRPTNWSPLGCWRPMSTSSARGSARRFAGRCVATPAIWRRSARARFSCP